MIRSLFLIACLGLSMNSLAAPLLVENGEPRAEIIIAEEPSRTTRLAAAELRHYLEEISGAKLAIQTVPSGSIAQQIYVGQSSHTEKLGISADDLKAGAYRIVSGDHWLVLIGDDSEFTPLAPFAQNNGDIPRAREEWQQIVGAPYGLPNAGLYKNRLRLPGDLGKPEGATTEKNETLEIWGLDERGSFNAVCGLLRRLGVRWYLPGEIGEVVPSLNTIEMPQMDETVQPDFPLRQFNFRFSTAGVDTSMWAMHLGTRQNEKLQIAHGLSGMTNNEAVFAAHPEWFALYGGKRDFKPGDSKCQLCYSDDGLFQETVRYARAQLDQYQLESVSIMPPDGYTSICQCEKCQGKDSPERDERGRLSNHVWDFVNRVAKEIGKTHPNAKVLNCAYGVYTLPPLNIEKLEPNVVVCIVGGRRPINKAGSKGEGESAPEALRAGWVKKTDNPILIFENYPFTDRGWYLPSFAPHAFGESINATKGISQGEDIWLSAGRDFDTVGIGFNHFMVYFTARMYWGGKEQDVDTIYREYCRLFYGPAEKEMLAFFDYCEANWLEMEKDKTKADRCLELFSLAQKKTDAESVHGKRLALIDDYLKGMRNKSQQLGQKRGPVPSLRLVGDASDIVIDGKLDEAYWENCPAAATGRLRELQTGRAPTLGTSIKAGWQSGNVYFAIRCEERPGEKPNQSATQEDDAAIWYGDAVEILLETESHSYYQIAVSPSGTITDVDRQGNQRQMQWDSKAEVATQIAEDHWSIEIRIPVTQDENDPLHQVIGRQPTPSLPWHFNICRQRIRDNGAEYSAFSPTGTDGFHHVMKFAQFYDGKSTKFDAAPPEPDFLETNRAATDLARKGKHEEALTAFVAIAAGKITDFQKSAALEQAAISARILKDFERAQELAGQIPIEAVSKTVRMENLLGQRKAEELITEFGEEKIESWPFWKTADGYDARGRAFSEIGNGDRAESDLTRALELVTDPADWLNLLIAIGINREKNLKDPAAALDAYQQMVTAKKNTGSATYYRGVQSAARLMQESGDFDGAIATLKQVDYGKLSGVWGGTFPLQVADTLLGAGNREEALTVYQSVADNESLLDSHRQAAKEAITQIRKGN